LRRFFGAGAGEDHFLQQAPAAMRLKIDPPIVRDDLLEFLRGSGCLALAEGSKAIETQLLNSVSDRHDRAVLTGLAESWRVRHPDTLVEVISRE
jgi:hypothetical protein